jgi:hypothetical protein
MLCCVRRNCVAWDALAVKTMQNEDARSASERCGRLGLHDVTSPRSPDMDDPFSVLQYCNMVCAIVHRAPAGQLIQVQLAVSVSCSCVNILQCAVKSPCCCAREGRTGADVHSTTLRVSCSCSCISIYAADYHAGVCCAACRDGHSAAATHAQLAGVRAVCKQQRRAQEKVVLVCSGRQ